MNFITAYLHRLIASPFLFLSLFLVRNQNKAAFLPVVSFHHHKVAEAKPRLRILFKRSSWYTQYTRTQKPANTARLSTQRPNETSAFALPRRYQRTVHHWTSIQTWFKLHASLTWKNDTFLQHHNASRKFDRVRRDVPAFLLFDSQFEWFQLISLYQGARQDSTWRDLLDSTENLLSRGNCTERIVRYGG